jgi:trk system potassium uptake protein TrkA
MRVVVCGAGQVGASIATYLAQEKNHVTVIDHNAELVSALTEGHGIQGVVGHASLPEVLRDAGAADAELLIAATHSDEVNMVACQVAHSVFKVPTKIARVRDQRYLDAQWQGNLFHRDHLPIDFVISPEIEVARSVVNRISTPGAYNIIPLADGLAQMVTVICREECPLAHTPIKHLSKIFPDLEMTILSIVRGELKIIVSQDDRMYPGDEVYFVASTAHLKRVMAAFGYEDPPARSAIIIGGGKIGTRIAQDIAEKMPHLRLTMIEADRRKAQLVSELMPDLNVICGDGLNRDILEEADMTSVEAVIAVMNSDESNILVSALAKQFGCERAIALINNTSLSPLAQNIGIDAVVNPRAITVSTILQHVRRGRIRTAHSLRDGFAEILELEALDTSAIINTPIKEIKRPRNMIFGFIVRDGRIYLPQPESIIKPEDRVIIMAGHDQVRAVEQMFSVRPEFF